MEVARLEAVAEVSQGFEVAQQLPLNLADLLNVGLGEGFVEGLTGAALTQLGEGLIEMLGLLEMGVLAIALFAGAMEPTF